MNFNRPFETLKNISLLTCINAFFFLFVETDDFTHLYTLIVRPDLTYEVKIDNYVAEAGHLEDDWDFLLPRKIVDPNMPKPEDWDERETIEDPMDKKPDVNFTLNYTHTEKAIHVNIDCPITHTLCTTGLLLAT